MVVAVSTSVLLSPAALVMGMGNIGGPGLDVVRHFRNRSILKDRA